MPETTVQPDPRRWKALVFVCLAELMIVLDGTILNVALPSAQHDLGFSDANRQWVITAYALAFGGLLLFGGRLADLWGRKRVFLTGVAGFTAASLLGGLAVSSGMLLGARALQGAFAALLAPSALALIAGLFTDTRERAKAFGVYGALAGGGAAVGLVLGGILIEYANWRWTLLINVFFGAVAAAGAHFAVTDRATSREGGRRLDVPGTVLATSGLAVLVYAFTRAESDGWTAAPSVVLLAGALVLLTAFAVTEHRTSQPLLPLRVVWDRTRGGTYLSLALAIIGMFGMFLFLTYYFQNVQGYSPLQTGLAFLPLTAGMMTGSTQIGARLVTRIPTRALMALTFLVSAAGLAILAQITPDSSYTAVLLPGMFVLGAGLGTAYTPAFALATVGVRAQDAGVASAMVNTSQQVGAAVGTALLNTLALTATRSYLDRHTPTRAERPADLHTEALVHGFATALWWGTGILVLAALLAALLITHRPDQPTPAPQSDPATSEA